MSDLISVGQVLELRDASDSNEFWAASLRESTGLSDVALLRLSDGPPYGLNKGDPRFPVWSEFLEWQRDAGLPVYVEAEGSTRVVREIFPAFPYRVNSVSTTPVEGRLPVTLRTSPAIFYLNPALPRFSELREKLERASLSGEEVLVTHHPLTLEIIDVRDVPSDAPELGNGGLLVGADSSAFAETEFAAPASKITLVEAREAFHFLAGSDIPFFFVRDCCTARAQKMCRLLREERNISARKIWNYGHGFRQNAATLFIRTKTDPSGKVFWRYHVAPTVSVVDADVDTMVIDPAIFKDGPVSIDTWVEEQNDGGAMQLPSSASVYENNPFGPDLFDPGPRAVDRLLNHHIGKWRLGKLYLDLF